MDIRNEYIWMTPDPIRVKRFIAICEAGRAKECYLGERWFVHQSQFHFLNSIGFMQCDVYKITVR